MSRKNVYILDFSVDKTTTQPKWKKQGKAFVLHVFHQGSRFIARPFVKIAAEQRHFGSR